MTARASSFHEIQEKIFSEMNGPSTIRTGDSRRAQPVAASIEKEVSALRKEIREALHLAERIDRCHGGITVDSSSNVLLKDLHKLLSGAESKISEPALKGEVENLFTRINVLRRSRFECTLEGWDPPVRFCRIERLVSPMVETNRFSEGKEPENPSGLEAWLDSVFSNEAIYDEAIKGLRDRCVFFTERNQALERNLDEAEAEILYWRRCAEESRTNKIASESLSEPPLVTLKESRRVQTDTVARKVVDEKLWKHAVAKFIGSFDQFSELKYFLHWRMHVKELRCGEKFNSTS